MILPRFLYFVYSFVFHAFALFLGGDGDLGRLTAAFSGSHQPAEGWLVRNWRRPRKTPHRGVFAGKSITRRKPLTFFFSFKKKVSKEKCALRKDAEGISLPAGSDQGAALDLQAFEKA